jgi:hypothetical protein
MLTGAPIPPSEGFDTSAVHRQAQVVVCPTAGALAATQLPLVRNWPALSCKSRERSRSNLNRTFHRKAQPDHRVGKSCRPARPAGSLRKLLPLYAHRDRRCIAPPGREIAAEPVPDTVMGARQLARCDRPTRWVSQADRQATALFSSPAPECCGQPARGNILTRLGRVEHHCKNMRQLNDSVDRPPPARDFAVAENCNPHTLAQPKVEILERMRCPTETGSFESKGPLLCTWRHQQARRHCALGNIET